MAKNLHPPEKLLLTGNLKDNFRKFKQQFEIYITAAGISNSTENIKCATLLHVIGPDAIEIFNTFRWNEEGDNEGDDKKMSKVLSKFEKYCTPKCNVTYERHQFNTRNQKEGESIDSYVTELRILSKSCEFGVIRFSHQRQNCMWCNYGYCKKQITSGNRSNLAESC